LCELECSSID